jgi:hypothetical protein
MPDIGSLGSRYELGILLIGLAMRGYDRNHFTCFALHHPEPNGGKHGRRWKAVCDRKGPAAGLPFGSRDRDAWMDLRPGAWHLGSDRLDGGISGQLIKAARQLC